MKKNLVLSSILSGALLTTAGISFAQTGPANAYGIVVSSTPLVQQVTVPKQICTHTTVTYQQPTGGGALIDALMGGAIGNQFGRGDGRAVATAIGALGGGIMGNQIEAQRHYPDRQNCRTKNVVENRTVAQSVVYDYLGHRYTVQMPVEGDFRPGMRLALHVEAPATYQIPSYVYATPPQQTVTYLNPVLPVVYYQTYDTYRDAYRPHYYNSTYYAPPSHLRPVYNPAPPRHVGNVNPNRPHVRHDRDDRRYW